MRAGDSGPYTVATPSRPTADQAARSRRVPPTETVWRLRVPDSAASRRELTTDDGSWRNANATRRRGCVPSVQPATRRTLLRGRRCCRRARRATATAPDSTQAALNAPSNGAVCRLMSPFASQAFANVDERWCDLDRGRARRLLMLARRIFAGWCRRRCYRLPLTYSPAECHDYTPDPRRSRSACQVKRHGSRQATGGTVSSSVPRAAPPRITCSWRDTVAFGGNHRSGR